MKLCSLSLFIFVILHWTSVRGQSSEDGWSLLKHSHPAQPLNSRQVETLARLGSVRTFKRELEPLMVSRVVGTEGHEQVKDYLIKTMHNLGWKVEKDAFDDQTPHGRKSFTNVIATLKPDARRQLVLACHYDSKYMGREGGFIGATDSAVPCAMMIDVATTMKKELLKLKKSNSDLSLQFIFFDGEEAFRKWTSTDSIYGARNLARVMEQLPYPDTNSATNHLHRIDLMVLLDLIGAPKPKFSAYLPQSARWFQEMARIEGQLYQLGLIRKLRGMEPYFTNEHSYASLADDHLPFYHRGVPVLHVISYPFPSVWHTMGDNQDALHMPTIMDLNLVMRVFVSNYLHLNV